MIRISTNIQSLKLKTEEDQKKNCKELQQLQLILYKCNGPAIVFKN